MAAVTLDYTLQGESLAENLVPAKLQKSSVTATASKENNVLVGLALITTNNYANECVFVDAKCRKI